MDKRITARFYDVYKLDPHGPALRDVLNDIFNLGEAQSRQATLGSGVIARLERLETHTDYLTGEFTRVQNTNFPSEVHADRVEPLQVAGPLGHGVAFLFRFSDSLLAIQYEPRVLAPSRINSYFLEMRSDAAYEFRPRMNQDNWTRLTQLPLRKLTIGVASPTDLVNVEDEGESVATSLRRMGEAYEAPSITIELGMGRRNGALSDSTKRMARQFFNMFRGSEIDLRKLRGTVETESGVPNDEINLIDEVLTTKDDLNLPDNDPTRSYEMRKNWIISQARSRA